MESLGKKFFIISLIFCVIASVVVSGNLWKSLISVRDELANIKVELTSTKQLLSRKNLELSTTKNDLEDAKYQISLTRSQLTTTEVQLSLVSNQLAGVENQLQTAIDENSQFKDSYVCIRNAINLRFGVSKEDRQSLITPANEIIMAKVQEITRDYSEDVNERWDDYERLYKWVVQNISYSYDSYLPSFPEKMNGTFTWFKGFWRLPVETLEDETGDCEDMALLLASMMKNYNKGKFTVWLISIFSDSANVGHMAVAYPVEGERLTILDPAGNYYTGMRQYRSLYSETATIAINNWLSHWSDDMPDAYVRMIFSEYEDEKFLSTAEFLTWLSER